MILVKNTIDSLANKEIVDQLIVVVAGQSWF